MPTCLVISGTIHISHPEKKYHTFCDKEYRGSEVEYIKGDPETKVKQVFGKLREHGKKCGKCEENAEVWANSMY